MTREQYIERLIAIFKLRYKPSQEEIEEFKLLLEMMPDKPIMTPFDNPTPNNEPWWVDPITHAPVVVMYGVQTPDTMYKRAGDGTPYTTTSISHTRSDEEGK